MWNQCSASKYLRFVFSHSGLEIHYAEIENDLMTLSLMLKSPHSVEFRLQMENLVQSLQDLGKARFRNKILKATS